MSTNQRIDFLQKIKPPEIILEELSVSLQQEKIVNNARCEIEQVLDGNSNKLVVIVGPCSIHDPLAALEYARFLKSMIDLYSEDLVIVMRTYFSKPRTTVGWKGYINDPDLNNTFQIDRGLFQARKLLLDILDLGVPCSMEQLDTILPQYFNDLLSWSAIGARTTESQVHRELASGISTPIGFKNSTDGNIKIAIQAIKSSQMAHNFLGCDMKGNICAVRTYGNPYSHIILRGSRFSPNYFSENVEHTEQELRSHNIKTNIWIDVSHDNSKKDYTRQILVAENVSQQIASGNKSIRGIMIESNLVEGKQNIENTPLIYGQSITDGCINLETTQIILNLLAESKRKRDDFIKFKNYKTLA
jgi:3-deoxy-7-phosphoheptulonate synthase